MFCVDTLTVVSPALHGVPGLRRAGLAVSRRVAAAVRRRPYPGTPTRPAAISSPVLARCRPVCCCGGRHGRSQDRPADRRRGRIWPRRDRVHA